MPNARTKHPITTPTITNEAGEADYQTATFYLQQFLELLFQLQPLSQQIEVDMSVLYSIEYVKEYSELLKDDKLYANAITKFPFQVEVIVSQFWALGVARIVEFLSGVYTTIQLLIRVDMLYLILSLHPSLLTNTAVAMQGLLLNMQLEQEVEPVPESTKLQIRQSLGEVDMLQSSTRRQKYPKLLDGRCDSDQFDLDPELATLRQYWSLNTSWYELYRKRSRSALWAQVSTALMVHPELQVTLQIWPGRVLVPLSMETQLALAGHTAARVRSITKNVRDHSMEPTCCLIRLNQYNIIGKGLRMRHLILCHTQYLKYKEIPIIHSPTDAP